MQSSTFTTFMVYLERISVQTAPATFVFTQWGAADAEIKVPSVESTELKGSPFKAWME